MKEVYTFYQYTVSLPAWRPRVRNPSGRLPRKLKKRRVRVERIDIPRIRPEDLTVSGEALLKLLYDADMEEEIDP